MKEKLMSDQYGNDRRSEEGDDPMFVLYAKGLVACCNARTGEEVFGQKRLPNGRAFTSSLWAMDGKLFCLSEGGVAYGQPQHSVLHLHP